MSFGFSVGDFLVAAQLVKETLGNIKSAPSDFQDAQKTLQSLDILLDSIKVEVNSPTSIFRRDAAQADQFANLVKLCQGPLKKLNAIITKYPSLGTDKTKIVDRLRFSKKAIIEIRGELSLRYSELSAYLETVGLGGIGRLEDKIENVQTKQDLILEAIDRVVAEARLKRRTASYLSDHSNDDKAIWKQLRRDLNDVGFKSADLERHKELICDKLKRLQDYGLLDWDSASGASVDGASIISTGTVTFVGHEKNKYVPPTVQTIYEGSETGSDYDDETVVAETEPPAATVSYLLWKGRSGLINLKARLVKVTAEHAHVLTYENEQIMLPIAALTTDELDRVARWRESNVPGSPDQSGPKIEEVYDRVSNGSSYTPSGHTPGPPAATEKALHPDYDETESEGERDTRPPVWHFRRSKDMVIGRIQSGSIHDDAFPAAAAKGDVKKVRRLLDRGANVEAQGPLSYSYTTTDSEGHTTTHRVEYPETTALWRAAENNHFETVHLLLRNGANPNTIDLKDRRKTRLLRQLIWYRREPAIIRLLLEYRCNVDAQDVLIIAAEMSPSVVVRDLLEHGADIERRSVAGETALYRAAWYGRNATVKTLLEEGANVDFRTKDGQSPLYKAAGQGHDRAVELLLMYGAKPTRGAGKAGESVLYKACRLGHERTVHLLLRRGANPDAENDFRPTEYGSKSELLMHILRPTEPAGNEYGLRPLYAAARLGHLEIIKLLLTYGADVNAMSAHNLPAVYIATKMGHKAVAQYLLSAGATLVDSRFIDPVAKMMSSDDDDSTQGLNDYADRRVNLPDNPLFAAFKKQSLREGGDGLKTLAKMFGVNSEHKPAGLVPILAMVSAAGFMGSGIQRRQ